MSKLPFMEVNGQTLCESRVICDYLEEAYPATPLSMAKWSCAAGIDDA